jgi:antitoxin HicB
MEIYTRTYSLSIERHPDGYLAYFPALEGCNTWGKTYEEAVMHAEEALALYLETFNELGKSIPKERGLKQPVSLGVTVRIPVIA